MPLREELERQGNWLFRWRSYPPLLVLPLLIAALAEAREPPPLGSAWPFICLGISLLGLAIRFYAVGHVPKQTSGRNTVRQMAAELNTTGIYSVARHPLYLGNLLIWVGVSLLPARWWAVLLTVLIFWIYYERIMIAEEEYLRSRFGATYEQWAAVTPAILPRLRGWQSPALPFSLRTAVRREYSSLFGTLATFAFLGWVRGALTGRPWRLDPFELSLLAVGAGVYVTLILVKKKTRLLHVEGR